MANDRRPASTPRIGRMLQEPESPPTRMKNRAVSRRLERNCQRRTLRRAGRRLLVGCLVIAGVALAVATDFQQFRAVAAQADTPHVAVSVVPAGRADTPR